MPKDRDDASSQDGNASTSDVSALLPESMSGQAAIDALGDKIDLAADRNNKTVDEFTELLLRDPTVHVSPSGRLVYIDTALPGSGD